MAGPAKKRNVHQQSKNRGDSESSAAEHVDVDFEGRNPETQDFHGIKQLLGQLFLKAHVDLSQISDMLIAQNGIGSVLKQSCDDDDEDEDDDMSEGCSVLGITSVLNISAHKETPCVVQLLSLLSEMREKYAPQEVKSELDAILTSSKKIGLLLNERFINIPAKISDPLLTSLLDEVTRMAKKDHSYNFDYYILICKLHKSKKDDGEIIFANAEEEIFDKSADFSFEFDVSDDSDTAVVETEAGEVEMIPYRRVLFVDGKKFGNIVKSIKEFVA